MSQNTEGDPGDDEGRDAPLGPDQPEVQLNMILIAFRLAGVSEHIERMELQFEIVHGE